VNIPDEAVEAAAKVLCEQMWENAHEKQRAYAREEARLALEAAAQYIAAEAWDEGEQAGAMNHAAEEYPEVKDITNPYRSQA
jgi:hypothetical protein